MAQIKIPATQKSFYNDSEISQNKARLNDIKNKYGSYIDTSARISNVDKKIITSFIFIESGGNPNAESGAGAIGLMQLIPNSASDILVLENKKGRLNEQEKSILRKYLGDRLDKGILKMKFLGDKVNVNGKSSAVWITKDDLLKPELNITIGTIYLGLLLDEHTIGNKIELHKATGRYNMGYFSKAGLTASSIDSYIKSVPTETKNYVVKLMGENGVLAIA